jgi:hypothetical protein
VAPRSHPDDVRGQRCASTSSATRATTSAGVWWSPRTSAPLPT